MLKADSFKGVELKVAVLDDYQGVAADMADWSSLPDGTEVEYFLHARPGGVFSVC